MPWLSLYEVTLERPYFMLSRIVWCFAAFERLIVQFCRHLGIFDQFFNCVEFNKLLTIVGESRGLIDKILFKLE